MPDRGPRPPRLLHVQPPRIHSTTLKEEYERDLTTGGPIAPPVDYFPGDDPAQAPENSWRSHGQLLYGNWINEIYQSTPYDIEAIGG